MGFEDIKDLAVLIILLALIYLYYWLRTQIKMLIVIKGKQHRGSALIWFIGFPFLPVFYFWLKSLSDEDEHIGDYDPLDSN